MSKQNFIRKAFASCLLVAISSIFPMLALAADKGDSTASLTVGGTVTVDGRAAISNTTITSGSTITTGESTDSVATVDLGKLGRVQLLSQSSLVLKYDQNGIYATLLVGKARVMSLSGVTSTVTTKEGITVGDTAQNNTFVVETECGRTSVNSEIGSAVLRADGQDKQIAAGTQAVAGNLQQAGCRPCLRPDPNQPFKPAKFGFFPFFLPLLGLGGATAAAVVAGSGNGNNTNINPVQGGIISNGR